MQYSMAINMTDVCLPLRLQRLLWRTYTSYCG